MDSADNPNNPLSTWQTHADELHRRLAVHADGRTKDWWESYVVDSAPFLGVKMGTIRSTLHEWYLELVEDTLSPGDQFQLAFALLFRTYTEEKLAGILFMQEILLPGGSIGCDRSVQQLSRAFASDGINDWNVCDWFCVKVLGPLIRRDGRSCAERIAGWRTADNLWRARASLVAFVGLVNEPTYYPLIREGCRVVVRRDERFAKTAVGWILREISRHDLAFVRDAVDELLIYLTSESLGNALKYFDKTERTMYRQRLRKPS